MKRRLLLILPLLLLLLAGAGAYALFGGGEAVAEVEVQDSPEPGVFVDLDTISLPVFRDGRVRRLIGLAITIEVAPGEDPERVAAALPRIEDAYITELTMLLGLDWPDGVSVDLEVARQRLLERMRKVTGAKTVSRVLFRSVQERAT